VKPGRSLVGSCALANEEWVKSIAAATAVIHAARIGIACLHFFTEICHLSHRL